MKDSFLSQDEIEALIRQAKAEPEDEYSDFQNEAESENGGRQETRYGQKGPAQTRKVVFNSIEPRLTERNNNRIEELNHVTFNLSIVLGETVLTVGELLSLKKDSVIVLDRLAGENARLLANGKHLADGEIVILNDCFALRVNFMEEVKRVSARVQTREEEREQ
ncbi:MAG: FliM/FliN family flagellar motor switch protein [Dethiobacter sp.]|jgi:flagellar motor switch protein FliN/FliY|nr:FliM/FliN family flagellar motor switch protein [Dethiobacter sp.]